MTETKTDPYPKAEGPVRMGPNYTTTYRDTSGWAAGCYCCGWYVWTADRVVTRAYANHHQCRKEATA